MHLQSIRSQIPWNDFRAWKDLNGPHQSRWNTEMAHSEKLDGHQEQKAFEDLKQAFTSAPVIIQPDSEKPFRVECDASGFTIRRVLSQQHEGHWRLCAYISTTMSEAERNYNVHNWKFLAIMKTFEAWRHYLAGSPHKIDIWSDHHNLQYFRTTRKLNRSRARWSAELQDYSFQITHKPGKTQARSDGLSQRRNHDDGSQDNEDQILLEDNLFVKRTEVIDMDLIRSQICDNSNYDEQVIKTLEALKGDNRAIAQDLKDWRVQDDLVYYCNRLYVPNDLSLRQTIVQLHHNMATTGHQGQIATILSVGREFWWPGMTTVV